MARVIFHIDLNSFYASAEEVLDPSLKGKPVVVSGLSRRSVVSTANYEARAYGVHSAMPIQEALELCPDLVVVKGHYSYYEELSEKFMKLIQSYTPYVEQASIDECYADMTEVIKRYPRPLDLAWQIQRQLKETLQLKCSIGVAPNKFLAKMASDMRKPMGITILRKSEVRKKLWPLSVSDMVGIGKKTAKALNTLGIETIGDLAEYPQHEILHKILGKNTTSVIQRCYGIASDEITMNSDAKSMSQSTTFLEDLTDYDEIRAYFKKLAVQLSQRLKQSGMMGNVVSISVRYYTFETIVRSKRLTYPIQDADALFEQAMMLYDENQDEMAVRHVGIGLSHLNTVSSQKIQLSLFEEFKPSTTDDVIKDLNAQLSVPSLVRASSLLKK
ncbi:MAG: DNA polymerase IV [Erysipelotrichaceae bacterium]|nr:DNA polymerase IV [Erysipelotrichaceae bacterium]